MKDSIIIMQHPWWAVETWEEDEERFIKGQNKLKLEKVNNEVKIKAVIWSLPRYHIATSNATYFKLDET